MMWSGLEEWGLRNGVRVNETMECVEEVEWSGVWQ